MACSNGRNLGVRDESPFEDAGCSGRRAHDAMV